MRSGSDLQRTYPIPRTNIVLHTPAHRKHRQIEEQAKTYPKQIKSACIHEYRHKNLQKCLTPTCYQTPTIHCSTTKNRADTQGKIILYNCSSTGSQKRRATKPGDREAVKTRQVQLYKIKILYNLGKAARHIPWTIYKYRLFRNAMFCRLSFIFYHAQPVFAQCSEAIRRTVPDSFACRHSGTTFWLPGLYY